LRAELETMRAQAAELQRLQAQPAPAAAIAGVALDSAVRAGAAALGGGFSVRLTGSRQLTAQGEVAFDRWIEWTAQLHSAYRLRLVRCQLRPGSAPGSVQVDAEFAAAD
jgi:type II secretory pathway component PulM